MRDKQVPAITYVTADIKQLTRTQKKPPTKCKVLCPEDFQGLTIKMCRHPRLHHINDYTFLTAVTIEKKIKIIMN